MIVQFPDADRTRRERQVRRDTSRNAVSIAAIRAGADSRRSTDHRKRESDDLSGGITNAARQRIRALTETEAKRRPMGESTARDIASTVREALFLRPELLDSVVAYLSPNAAERLSL